MISQQFSFCRFCLSAIGCNRWRKAFGCWFLALSLTLFSLVPRHWKVDPTVVKGDAASRKPVMGLEDFFYQSAQYKRRLLIPAILLFWAGIIGAAVLVF